MCIRMVSPPSCCLFFFSLPCNLLFILRIYSITFRVHDVHRMILSFLVPCLRSFGALLARRGLLLAFLTQQGSLPAFLARCGLLQALRAQQGLFTVLLAQRGLFLALLDRRGSFPA